MRQCGHALAQQRFQAGLGNRLAVLSAESAVLTQRRMAIDLQARQFDNRAQLMRLPQVHCAQSYLGSATIDLLRKEIGLLAA